MFRQKLKQGRPLVGTLVTLGSPAVAEMLSGCGFDWLWIDMEHAPLTLEHVQTMIQSMTKDCSALVRVPGNDEIWIKRVLDLGADGIIVPQVKSAEEASKAVAACKYPPDGIRSAGLARAHGYGMNFSEYISKANEMTTVLLQVEHVEGVRNIDAILSVPGVDGVIIGPYDLSGSFGKLGQIQDSEVQDCINTVFRACKKYGTAVGIFALQPEKGRDYIKDGFDIVAVGIDVFYLWNAAKRGLNAVLEGR